MEETSDSEDAAHRAEFEAHRSKFFELIGHCVTLFQATEDYLSYVFLAALGGSEERADALFSVTRGLEAKLNMISAALVGREEDLARLWPGLLRRITDAAKSRNQIAHATPTHVGATIVVTFDEHLSRALSAKRSGKDRMELRKKNRTGEATWTLDGMLEEYRRTDTLFGNLIAFVHMLKGEPSPAHLLVGLHDCHDG